MFTEVVNFHKNASIFPLVACLSLITIACAYIYIFFQLQNQTKQITFKQLGGISFRLKKNADQNSFALGSREALSLSSYLLMITSVWFFFDGFSFSTPVSSMLLALGGLGFLAMHKHIQMKTYGWIVIGSWFITILLLGTCVTFPTRVIHVDSVNPTIHDLNVDHIDAALQCTQSRRCLHYFIEHHAVGDLIFAMGATHFENVINTHGYAIRKDNQYFVLYILICTILLGTHYFFIMTYDIPFSPFYAKDDDAMWSSPLKRLDYEIFKAKLGPFGLVYKDFSEQEFRNSCIRRDRYVDRYRRHVLKQLQITNGQNIGFISFIFRVICELSFYAALYTSDIDSLAQKSRSTPRVAFNNDIIYY